MNFLANENFPLPSIRILENFGHKVFCLSKEAPGIADIDVIELAIKNHQIILTFDKDYGEIIIKNKIKNPPPVIFFRYKGKKTTFAGDTLISITQLSDIKKADKTFLKLLINKEIKLQNPFYFCILQISKNTITKNKKGLQCNIQNQILTSKKIKLPEK